MASSPAPFDLASPCVDIVARLRQRFVLAAHVVDQRAAAAFAGGDDHFDAVTIEQTDGGFVG